VRRLFLSLFFSSTIVTHILTDVSGKNLNSP
jgi:hypothetical protein